MFKLSLLGTTALWSPDDEGAGGGGLMGEHQTDDEKAAAEAAAEAAGQDGGDDDGQNADDDKGDTERPEWCPEQFWDKEKGEPRSEQMSKSYGELRNELNRMKTEGDGKAPEKAEEYLKDWKMPEKVGDESLDRIRDIPSDDPLMGAFASAAHKRGLSQESFDGMLSDVLVAMNGMMPEPYDEIGELEKLGGPDQGKAAIDTNKRFLQSMRNGGQLTAEEFNRGISMCSDALGVQLLDKLRVGSGEKPIPISLGQGGGGGKSEAELSAMMGDPLYREDGPKGDAYRAKVSQQIKDAVGDKPASSIDEVAFGG